jgi:hypothetical protein
MKRIYRIFRMSSGYFGDLVWGGQVRWPKMYEYQIKFDKTSNPWNGYYIIEVRNG